MNSEPIAAPYRALPQPAAECGAHSARQAASAPARSSLAGAAAAGKLKIDVCDDLAAAETHWRRLESEGDSTVYQSFEWAAAALETIEKQCRAKTMIVLGTMQDRPAFVLPLVCKGRLIRRVEWIGGPHVNFNFGLYSREFLEAAEPHDIRAIVDRIGAAIPGVGILDLGCQPEIWRGIANPMVCLPHQRSMNSVFAMDLSDGFEALLAKGNAKRKRKKFRQQCRQASEAGGYRMIVANSAEEVDLLLGEFCRQKSHRLRKLGISNTFASRGAQEMLSRLARRSLGCDEPVLQLFGLEIAGKIRAVFGAGVRNGHLSGYFSSISLDRMSHLSPGEMLLYMLVEHCAEQGVTSMDLGGGDERYKRSWCDNTVGLFDVILPVGAFGRPAVAALRFSRSVKRAIRQNPRAWAMVACVRRMRARLIWRVG